MIYFERTFFEDKGRGMQATSTITITADDWAHFYQELERDRPLIPEIDDEFIQSLDAQEAICGGYGDSASEEWCKFYDAQLMIVGSMTNLQHYQAYDWRKERGPSPTDASIFTEDTSD